MFARARVSLRQVSMLFIAVSVSVGLISVLWKHWGCSRRSSRSGAMWIQFDEDLVRLHLDGGGVALVAIKADWGIATSPGVVDTANIREFLCRHHIAAYAIDAESIINSTKPISAVWDNVFGHLDVPLALLVKLDSRDRLRVCEVSRNRWFSERELATSYKQLPIGTYSRLVSFPAKSPSREMLTTPGSP